MNRDFDHLADDLGRSVGEVLSRKAEQAVEYSAFEARKRWKKAMRVPKGAKKGDFVYHTASSDDAHEAVVEGATNADSRVRDRPDRSYLLAELTAENELERGMSIAVDQALAEFGF